MRIKEEEFLVVGVRPTGAEIGGHVKGIDKALNVAKGPWSQGAVVHLKCCQTQVVHGITDIIEKLKRVDGYRTVEDMFFPA